MWLLCVSLPVGVVVAFELCRVLLLFVSLVCCKNDTGDIFKPFASDFIRAEVENIYRFP